VGTGAGGFNGDALDRKNGCIFLINFKMLEQCRFIYFSLVYLVMEDKENVNDFFCPKQFK